MGYLMVCKWKFPSLKSFRLAKIPSFHWVFIGAVVAVIFLYAIIHFFPYVLAFISWGYILLALILTIIRLIAGKRSKTLKDFEPEEDESDDDHD